MELIERIEVSGDDFERENHAHALLEKLTVKTLHLEVHLVAGILSWQIKIPQYVEICEVMSYLIQIVFLQSQAVQLQ